MEHPTRLTAASVDANVRAEVARRSIPQRDIAQALGIDQRAVSRRMRGHVEFSASELQKLAELLDVEVSAFYAPGVPA